MNRFWYNVMSFFIIIGIPIFFVGMAAFFLVIFKYSEFRYDILYFYFVRSIIFGLVGTVLGAGYSYLNKKYKKIVYIVIGSYYIYVIYEIAIALSL